MRWLEWTERGLFDAEGRLTEIQAAGQDISERKEAESREQEYIDNLAFLSKTAMGFVELPVDEDIFSFTAGQLRKLVGDSVVVVNSFDRIAGSFTIQAHVGADPYLEAILRILGRDPVGMTFAARHDQTNPPVHLQGRLVRVERSLHDLGWRYIPDDILSGLEHVLGIGAVYSQTFSVGEQLFGSATILVQGDGQLRNRDLVETFINQASVALQRRRAEDALRDKEEQLRQLNKMEALGRLAGGVAHDFGNILANILGYASLIRSGLPDDSPLSGDMDLLIRSCQRAADMTAELLNFARGGTIELTAVDLNSIVREVNDLLWERFGEFIEVDLRLAEQLPQVRGDAPQVHQVVLNLALNAFDAVLAAADPGGWSTPQVILQTYPISLDEAAAQELSLVSGDYVCLRVDDTGFGMDAESIRQAFDPFFTTKNQDSGMLPSGRQHSGLGLPTVYSVVQSHHGAVKVDSTLGAGTSFSVYWPDFETRESNLASSSDESGAGDNATLASPAQRTLDGTS